MFQSSTMLGKVILKSPYLTFFELWNVAQNFFGHPVYTLHSTHTLFCFETSVLQNSVTEKNLLEIMEEPKTKEAEANNNNEVKQRPQVHKNFLSLNSI